MTKMQQLCFNEWKEEVDKLNKLVEEYIFQGKYDEELFKKFQKQSKRASKIAKEYIKLYGHPTDDSL